MVLHTVITSGTAMTGSGTVDTFAGTSYSPSGENEVQQRDQVGGLPSLIGYDGVISDIASATTATGGNYFKILMNTWENARYLQRPWRAWLNANAGGSAITKSGQPTPYWLDTPIALDRDADFSISGNCTTANSAYAIALYESYGTVIPWMGESDTFRLVSAAADLVANTWGTIGTITDLDPRYKYRVNSLIIVAEDQVVLAARLTSPSNSTYVGAVSNHLFLGTVQDSPWETKFVPDSIYVDGVETVTIEGLVDAAQKPSVYVGLKRIGASGTGTVTGGGLGGTITNPTLGNGGGGINLGGLLGGLFGGR